MQIIPIPALKDNYIWAIVNDDRTHAIIIDPGEALPVIDFLTREKMQLHGILLTHHHWDHTNGVKELTSMYDIPVYAGSSSHNKDVTHRVNENDKIKFGNVIELTALTIPGHTLDHTAYYAPGVLFSGDTLFLAGCGRLFEGTAEQMFASLQKLSELPDATNVYCAHEYTLKNLHFAETIEPDNLRIKERIITARECMEKNIPTVPALLAEEKATNPFLRCNEPTVRNAAEKFAGFELANPLEVFRWVRKMKDEY